MRTKLLFSLVLAGFALLLGGKAFGQTSFSVRLAQKTSSHPWHGQGSQFGFAVDGVEGHALTLVRGQSYTFDVATGRVETFYITDSPIGGSNGNCNSPFSVNVSGAPTVNGTVTFTPDANTPNQLYYQSCVGQFVGGAISIVDPVDQMADEEKVQICHMPPGKPNKRKTLTVGASSVQNHLNHGDRIGPCQ